MTVQRNDGAGAGVASPGSESPGRSDEHGFQGPLGVLDRFLVTLSQSGAVSYLVENLAVAHGRRQRLRHSLARSLDLAGMRRLLDDSGAAGRVPGRFREPLRLLQLVLESAGESLFADSPFQVRPPAGFILLADYENQTRGQAVFFLFAADEDRPKAVLKLRPLQGDDGDGDGGEAPSGPLVREAAALDRLAALPTPLAATVPRRRAFHRLPEVAALLTSVLPGRSAYVELHRGVTLGAGAARHLELAAAWLGRFHRATRRTVPWRPPSPDDSRFDPVRHSNGSVPDWFLRLVDDLETSPLPISAGHGDFWARNLLVPPDGWVRDELGRELPGIVDWEGYQPAAEPFEDLFHFPWTYAGLHPTGRRWTRRVLPMRPEPLTAFRRAFLDDTVLARQVRRYFEIYTVGAGLPWALLRPLFRLFLLTRAAGAGETSEGSTSGDESSRDETSRDETSRDETTEEEGIWLSAYRTLDSAPRSVFSG